MTITVSVIYNFLVSLFLVTSAFLLGMILKNKIKPPKKQHGDLHNSENKANQVSDSTARPSTDGTTLSAQNSNVYKQVLEGAQTEAKNLIAQTNIRAYEMISGVRQTNEKIEEDLDRILSQIAAADIKSLKETTAQFDRDYKQTLDDINAQMQKTAVDMVAKTQQEYSQKLDEFIKELLKSATATKAITDKKTAELLSIAEADIADYKKQKMAQADDEVRKLTQRAFRDVLRRSIPETLHEDLIMQSLDEAKRDEIFKP